MLDSLVTILIACVLSVFSTTVMCYISIATPIGPWIGPTLVLTAMIIYRSIGLRRMYTSGNLALVTCAGSIGGILATAIGFSFPTLYFLDKPFFNQLLEHPWYFSSMMSIFCLISGGFALAIANGLQVKLIEQDNLSFPVGKLIHKMIAAHQGAQKAYELMLGFISSFVFSLLRTGIKGVGILPSSYTLIKSRVWGFFVLPAIRIDVSIWPMLLAIGFVTGHVIALPLLIGALTKIIIADPVNIYFFKSVPESEFILAFCSGMVLCGVISSFIKLPASIMKGIKSHSHNGLSDFVKNIVGNSRFIVPLVLWLVAVVGLFVYYQFSLLALLFVIIASSVCVYEVAVIAGEIGIAPLGRFATFVMVPAMLMFNLNYMQLVLIATFVELTGGVACDVLFGRKIAQLSHVDQRAIERFQYIGLIVSSLSVGIVFWLLSTSLGLGSDSFFAYKAQSRQLLIQAKTFNYVVLLVGCVFGYILSWLRINAMLVLGGLLMPLTISLGLIVGGLGALWTKNKEELYPFWSGVFAANSIWMLLRAIL